MYEYISTYYREILQQYQDNIYSFETVLVGYIEDDMEFNVFSEIYTQSNNLDKQKLKYLLEVPLAIQNLIFREFLTFDTTRFIGSNETKLQKIGKSILDREIAFLLKNLELSLFAVEASINYTTQSLRGFECLKSYEPFGLRQLIRRSIYSFTDECIQFGLIYRLLNSSELCYHNRNNIICISYYLSHSKFCSTNTKYSRYVLSKYRKFELNAMHAYLYNQLNNIKKK